MLMLVRRGEGGGRKLLLYKGLERKTCTEFPLVLRYVLYLINHYNRLQFVGSFDPKLTLTALKPLKQP